MRPNLSVSELNQAVKQCLELHFSQVTITGEISNLARPRSGHLYFSLKDAHAQVQCAWFRPPAKLAHALKNGEEVVAHARVSLYTNRGDYQLIVQSITATGEGLLQQRFEQLKRTLQSEGLFEKATPLPHFPHRLGLVTSPSGAAIEDMKRVILRRYPLVDLHIFPTDVQGIQSAPSIVQALQAAKDAQLDLIILSRGGGSLEDLWGFNEESVARAMFAIQTPIITGIGHEIDTTIADYVADCRAATPSAAAERATPDQTELKQLVDQYQRRLNIQALYQLQQHKERLKNLQHRVINPKERLMQHRLLLTQLRSRLPQAIKNRLSHHQHALSQASEKLAMLSPLHTLQRGYALPQDAENKPITSVQQCTIDQTILLKLKDGMLHTQILEIQEDIVIPE